MSLVRAFSEIFGVTGTVAIFGAEGFALGLIGFHLYSILTLV